MEKSHKILVNGDEGEPKRFDIFCHLGISINRAKDQNCTIGSLYHLII